MTLSEKISLIIDLIRESPESTIGDYLDTIREIEAIQSNKKQKQMSRILTPAYKEAILKMAAEMTVADIRRQTNLSFFTIYDVLKRANVDIKRLTRERELAEARKKLEEEEKAHMSTLQGRLATIPASLKPEAPKVIERPKASYSNSSPWGIATEYHNQKAAS